MEAHEKAHFSSFQCEFCSKSFSYKRNRRQHIQTVHAVRDPTRSATTNPYARLQINQRKGAHSTIREEEVQEWISELRELKTPLTVGQAVVSLEKYLDGLEHPNAGYVTEYYVKKFTNAAQIRLLPLRSLRRAVNLARPQILPINPQPKIRQFDNVCILETTSIAEENGKSKKYESADCVDCGC
jgi:tetrahydrodipicolinate N-succinyltransferase